MRANANPDACIVAAQEGIAERGIESLSLRDVSPSERSTASLRINIRWSTG